MKSYGIIGLPNEKEIKMKQLISFILILCMLLSVTSCALIDKMFGKQVPPDYLPPEDLPPEDTPSAKATPKLNGADIIEYTIIYDFEGLDYNKRAAEYINNTLKERFDVKLDVKDDSNAKTEREIVIGETSRDISRELDADTSGFEFSMLTKDGSVALEGDYFVIAAAAYFFMNTYLIDSDHDFITEKGVTTHQPIVKEAKNFILLIGDGMGVNQTKLFDYLPDTSEYSDGESAFYGYMFPSQGFSRTNSFSGTTDSAAGGTALATGYKTNNKYVGLDRNGNEIKSLTELAAELGKATAVMSTESNTGATPSTFSAHTLNRSNSSEIREDQAALVSKYGTIIDCGYDYYTARYMKTIENHITDTLSKVSKDEDGFFLMYEEAHIDKHSHDNDMAETFLALIRFNQAIARFMEFAFYNPETMVIITADHETGALLPDGNGGLKYNSEDHSSADVPVFAWGDGSDLFMGNTVENIEIAKHIAKCMGVDNFGDQSKDWYDEIYDKTEKIKNDTDLPIIPVNP